MMRYRKIEGLEKIREWGLPYPPYGVIDAEQATPSNIESIIDAIGIPEIEGDRTGIVIRTDGAGRAGGRSDLHLMDMEEIINWALRLRERTGIKLIIQHVVDAKCSGVLLKSADELSVEVVRGDAPSLLEGRTGDIERWTYTGTWNKESEMGGILSEGDRALILKYARLVPEYSYLEWSLSKIGKLYFYEYMQWRRRERKAPAGESIRKTLIRGLSASPGVATGTVKVALDSEEINRVRDGDVLVIRYADRHVMHVINRLSALVCDVGGRTSHASIIAREYGVPCVIAESATKRLRDGTKVVVDGYNGTVSVL